MQKKVKIRMMCMRIVRRAHRTRAHRTRARNQIEAYNLEAKKGNIKQGTTYHHLISTPAGLLTKCSFIKNF